MSGQSFPLHVIPKIPGKINRLDELANNFWYSWHRSTRNLFNMLDSELWWKVGRNPKVFLRCVDQSILEMAARNQTFLGAYRQVLVEFDSYREQGVTDYRAADLKQDDLIAYFCAEYGFHESFPVYSGGLGILAGDHCKTASDLHLPFVAVGLLYHRGYFRQHIDSEGNQIAEYPNIEPEDISVSPLTDDTGNEISVQCSFPDRQIDIKIWRADIGNVPVLFLDTDVPTNDENDRKITRTLYGGDTEHRIQQEIILGIGGVKALRAAGMRPAVWHVNEGHAAFLILERAREKVESGLTFRAAIEAVAANTVFTTHTPVAAGHDSFPPELVSKYLQVLIDQLDMDEEMLSRLGERSQVGKAIDMTRLAILGSRAVNGVSKIHAGVSSEIYADVWPDVPPDENPIGYVTNGVHVPTFLVQDWAEILEQYLGPSWRFQITDRELMNSILEIPDGRFWYVNQKAKSDMLAALRERLRRQFVRNRVSESHGRRMLKFIDPENPDVLTIGFGRRFATYKRATLLLEDLDWLREIVDKDERPVVFIFAGKAHPADEPGQEIIRTIHRAAGMPGFIGKILLVEGYDIGLGRLLTSGVDVWLNTPTYPLEASGTSGMKAAINGTVNLSVLDGWWAEAYDGQNGWAIPASSNTDDHAQRDQDDARTLYEILQDDVIPMYYDRTEKAGHSSAWVQLCKRSMASVLPHFNSYRVLDDYACRYYGPAARRGKVVAADGYRIAIELAEWKQRVQAAWPDVSLRLASNSLSKVAFDDALVLEVEVNVAGLEPGDVRVECILRRDTCSELTVPVRQYADNSQGGDGIRYLDDEAIAVIPLLPDGGANAEGICHYRCEYQSPWCGTLTYEIRAVPWHPNLSHPYEIGLMRWCH